MNAALFARIDALMSRRAELGLTAEQDRVLELYHRMFVRAGARLEGGRARAAGGDPGAAGEARHRVRPERAGRREGLGATARTRDLEGLPDWLVAAAAQAAASAGRTGHVITLSRSLIVPFLRARPGATCARAPSAPGARAARTAAPPTTAPSLPRCSRSVPSGRGCSATRASPPASSSTEMAKTPEAVRELLMAVWGPARAAAEADAARWRR